MGRDAVTLFGATGAVGILDTYDLDGNGIVRDESSPRRRAPDRWPLPSSTATCTSPTSTRPSSATGCSCRTRSASTSRASIASTRTCMRASTSTASTRAGRTSRSAASARSIRTAASSSSRPNNSWSKLKYTALELTATKNLSHGFQFMAGINRQWQHMGGDWNPTDPARFIQPSAFANDKLLYMPRGNNEENSLPITTGTTVHTYGPTWQKYRLNFGGSWYAPYGVVLAASYTIEAGPWTGPVVDAAPRRRPAARGRSDRRPSRRRPASRSRIRCPRACGSRSRRAATAR